MSFQVMDVAKYIINYCTEQGKPVSNLKLQKMLYYLWIDYYKNTSEYLFDEDICAWPFGPVVPSVYFEYCSYAGAPITKKYSDLDDIFSSFFGGGFSGRSSRSQRRGNDLRHDITLSLEDAVFGKKMEIKLDKNDICDVCHGTGAEPGTKTQTCPTCGGSGEVRMSQGFFSVRRTCSKCNGSGSIVTTPCKKCRGTGTVKKNKTISVNIPKGIEDNTQLRVSGEGEAIGGGVAGDLYLYIHVSPHQYFVRDGIDLITEVGINIVQATLGADIYIQTLDKKKVKIKIPAGTNSGQVFKLKGSGATHINRSGRGDLFVIVNIDVSSKLSSEEKRLYNELKKVTPNNDEPTLRKPSRNNW